MKVLNIAAIGRSLLLTAALGCAAVAQATPITYLFSGLATGHYVSAPGQGPQAFSRQELSVSITTDTANIDSTRFGASIPATHDLVGGGQISVAGVGSGTFNDLLYVFVNHGTQTVGFGSLAANDLIDVRHLGAGLATYGLDTDFGPLLGTPPNFVAQFQNIALSFGNLSLDSLADATFQAITGNAVPEPQNLALVGLGLTLLVTASRRRRLA